VRKEGGRGRAGGGPRGRPLSARRCRGLLPPPAPDLPTEGACCARKASYRQRKIHRDSGHHARRPILCSLLCIVPCWWGDEGKSAWTRGRAGRRHHRRSRPSFCCPSFALAPPCRTPPPPPKPKAIPPARAERERESESHSTNERERERTDTHTEGEGAHSPPVLVAPSRERAAEPSPFAPAPSSPPPPLLFRLPHTPASRPRAPLHPRRFPPPLLFVANHTPIPCKNVRGKPTNGCS
jgi:hypothetical protein